MAFEQELADRVRELIAGRGVEADERRMFGGLAFLVNGNMALAVSGQGGAMVRVDPAEEDQLLETTAAIPTEMRGQTMTGWLDIADGHLATEDDLAVWVERGVARAQALPAK